MAASGLDLVVLPRVSTALAGQLAGVGGPGGADAPPPVPAAAVPPAGAGGGARAVLVALAADLGTADEAGVLAPPAAGGGQDFGAGYRALVASLQADTADPPSVAAFAAAFRAACCDAAEALFDVDRAQATKASALLDAGNERLVPLEREAVPPAPAVGPPPAATDPLDVAAVPGLAHLAPFWEASPAAASLGDVLALGAARGTGGVRRAGAPRKRGPDKRRDGGRKRQAGGTGAAGGFVPYGDLTPALQAELAGMLAAVVAPGSSHAPPAPCDRPAKGLVKLHTACVDRAAELRASHAAEAVRELAVDLGPACARLRAGEYDDVDDVCQDVVAAARAAAEAAADAPGAAGGVRRGKLMGLADQFALALCSALTELATDHAGKGAPPPPRDRGGGAGVAAGGGRGVEGAPPPPSLPESVLANREPFFTGTWRRRPYQPRPYERLTAYEVASGETGALAWKLTTTKAGACDGAHCTQPGALGQYRLELDAFDTRCACLARNVECGPACKCDAGGKCLNRAVTHRHTLKLGVDVKEINSWGVDCYTRRNVTDAVLESEAFGPYKKPDYAALAAEAEAAAAAMARGEAIRRDGASPGGGRPATAGGASEETRDRVTEWVERTLEPAINRQGAAGWDMGLALAAVVADAEAAGDAASLAAARAVQARVAAIGSDYFRVHPKGVGVVCQRPGGLPPLTFVEEYLGEVHAPWRWFEIQDAIKKCSRDELPDFYNIVLERPRDDPAGYDVLFVDAASKGAFASRMSHSCTPNCQAVVMACGGRLTIAVYTLRHVHVGEELTFDYASVTESEKEFRAAVCLCGTAACRGSFLTFSGSRAFQQVMNERHTVLHRQAIILNAACAPVTDADRALLAEFGLGEAALGRAGTPERAPQWLVKWAALTLAYVKAEREHLPAALLALPPPHNFYTPAGAAAEAKGVADSRLQNVVITIDKVKLCLDRPGQLTCPPVRRLTDDETLDHLWRGPRSVARRLLRSAAAALSNAAVARAVAAATTPSEVRRAIERNPGHPNLARLAEAVLAPASTPEQARANMASLVPMLREFDMAAGGGHTAAADIMLMYATTRVWFFAERNFLGFTSPAVRLKLDDLGLDRLSADELSDDEAAAAAAAAATSSRRAAGPPPPRPETVAADDAAAARMGLAKKYGPWYIWGQLSGWFKQTVYDPTASLSADRRGTISLPDAESCYGSSRSRYGPKDRDAMLEHIEQRPEAMWKVGTIWSFKNESKIYGSPMFDSKWAELTGDFPDPVPPMLADLRSAPLPYFTAAAAPAPRPRPRPRARRSGTPPVKAEAAPLAPALGAGGSPLALVPGVEGEFGLGVPPVADDLLPLDLP